MRARPIRSKAVSPAAGLLSLVAVRFRSARSACFALGAFVCGCAVYQSELLGTGGGPSVMGGDAGSGGTSGMSGGSVGGGASSSGTGGTPPSEGGNVPSGGTPPLQQGGAPPSDGGMGGEEPLGGASGSGGAGGEGGGPPMLRCSDQPLTAKTSWVESASSSSMGNGMESDALYNPPAHLTDGMLTERWSSGKSQAGGEWIQIDFTQAVALNRITLQLGTNPDDYPRGYEVRVSAANEDFTAPVLASGAGVMTEDLVVDLDEPASGRYLTVRQTGTVSTTIWWSIAELLVDCVE